MERFKNFLYYEWKKILALVFVLVIVLVTVRQCSQKVPADLGVLYIGGIKTDDLSPLGEDIKKSGIVSDADGDGVESVKTRIILVSGDEAINIEQQVYQQIQLELISGENLLYLIDEKTLELNASDYNFADITDTADKYPDLKDRCKTYENGSVYAISLEGNSYLERCGINTENMYIARRNFLPEDKDSILNHNAKKAMEYILER